MLAIIGLALWWTGTPALWAGLYLCVGMYFCGRVLVEFTAQLVALPSRLEWLRARRRINEILQEAHARGGFPD